MNSSTPVLLCVAVWQFSYKSDVLGAMIFVVSSKGTIYVRYLLFMSSQKICLATYNLDFLLLQKDLSSGGGQVMRRHVENSRRVAS